MGVLIHFTLPVRARKTRNGENGGGEVGRTVSLDFTNRLGLARY
jgi:hypothetical protein